MGGARTVAHQPAVVWDNIGLLDEMFGGGGTSVKPPSTMSTAVYEQTPLGVDQARQHSNSVVSMTPPPPYSRNRSSSTLSSSFQSLNVSRPSPLSRYITMSGPDIDADSRGHERARSGTNTTFDPDGASLLFSDLKPFVPLHQAMSPPQQQPSAPLTRRSIPPPPHLARSYQDLQSGLVENQVPTDTQPAEPKTLSTIPQNLIFQRDGVKYPSPPSQNFAVPVKPSNPDQSAASYRPWLQAGTPERNSELNGASSDPLVGGPNAPMANDSSNATTLSQPHHSSNTSPQPQPQPQIQQQMPTRELPASFRDRMHRMPPDEPLYRDQTREAQSNPMPTALAPVREPGQSNLQHISLLPHHPTFSPLLATHLGSFDVTTDSAPQSRQASFELRSRVPPPPHRQKQSRPPAPRPGQEDFAQTLPINKTIEPTHQDIDAQAADTSAGAMIPSWSQAGSGPQAIDPYFMTQGSVRYIGPSSVAKSREPDPPPELSSVKFAPDPSELGGISVAMSPGGEPRELSVTGEVRVPSRAELA
ncbi:hypothetical protein B0T22DRAFT_457933 [Podospora appendiculata]|uniref:Uncharacterized protein n=1 Tax=Podospora appendiculata TaxID=314037 RepID=A0AAE0X7X2_9PEZI|nr:hypothetical protein B0T22DRAFT_457933 [Podospora appendiculata]